MFQLLHILTVILVAIAMALSLAHVLELPGKLRLDRDTYLKVQTIYYPGFTIGGISEPLAALALLMLLFMTQTGTTAFWLMLGGAWVRLVGIFLWHYGARNRIFTARDRALNSAYPAGRRPDSEDHASNRPR